jgi:DNA mismatch repair protein MutS2
LDGHSLERLEFFRVTQAIASLARSARAAAAVAALRPFDDRGARAVENARLAEAIRRHAEPGEWCHVGRGDLLEWIGESDDAGERGLLSGAVLVEIGSWLAAGAETRAAWADPDPCERFRDLGLLASRLPRLEALERRLSTALEPDGRVSDGASPELKRARAELASGERSLQQRLERWAKGFGETAYVTRHGDRYVALVPAAGFSRRRGIVHDVSGSGQSLFVEPIEMCEANNHLIEVAARAADEERKVLIELSRLVLDSRLELLVLEETLVQLDTLRARARWAADVSGRAIEPAGTRLRLRGARHPLLAMGPHRDRLVPLDLELDTEGRLLLVSGPNMGGKTVLLKTVGLTVALAHAALPVPCAEGSVLPELDELLVDLGDEQSVDRGLSTFAAHLEMLAMMTVQAGPRTLLLCDELGAGTDPEEGAALGRALVERFATRGAWAVITTHLGSLKMLAGEVPGVVNGSLEFDTASLSPRYRFLPGIPGASHALTIAQRLGLDPEIVGRARELTPHETEALERLLEELQRTQRRMEEESARLAEARAAAESAARESREATEEGRRALAEMRRRFTRESETLVARARELWQSIQREARRNEKTKVGVTEAREKLASVEGDIASLHRSIDGAEQSMGGAEHEATTVPFDPRTLAAGSRVRVLDLGVEAEVVAPPDPEGKVLLRRGSWSINTHVSRIAPSGTPESHAEANPKRVTAPPRAAATWQVPDQAPLEIDLRGMEVEEALRTLDDGLDRSLVSGLSQLRIIHGVGRGILRSAVERHLRQHPQVSGQRMGELGEGGRGVTVATLR